MKIAVLGGNGQLGSDLVEVLTLQGQDVVALSHQDIQVEEISSVRSTLGELQPDVVLNTAAFHNVPLCEEDPHRAFSVNAAGAFNVARVANDLEAINVYYSTDYVFDGSRSTPYDESFPTSPLNVYATSKLAGETLTLNYHPRSYVIRVSGIYGKVPCRAKGDHFVSKMISLSKTRPEVRVVTDEVLTPTPTLDIAENTLPIVTSGQFGLFHLTCEGSCSWYEFTRELYATLGIETPLLKAKVSDFPAGVARPHYSVLENRRLSSLGPSMPHWREALQRYLRESHLTQP